MRTERDRRPTPNLALQRTWPAATVSGTIGVHPRRAGPLSFFVRCPETMAKNTPSIAKNQMRRCLRAIVDPHPTDAEVSSLWGYFESACAYCGRQLERKGREGHVDHLVAHSAGGTNSIYNHVLSCNRCNGDEKREEDWESFLARKALVPLEFERRRGRVCEWLAIAEHTRSVPEASEQVESIISRAIESFDCAVEQLRSLRQQAPNPSIERTAHGKPRSAAHVKR